MKNKKLPKLRKGQFRYYLEPISDEEYVIHAYEILYYSKTIEAWFIKLLHYSSKFITIFVYAEALEDDKMLPKLYKILYFK